MAPKPLGPARAMLLAWAAIGVVNVIATNVAAPVSGGGSLRFVRGAYDLGHALALGLVSGLVVLAYSRARLALGSRLSRRAAIAVDVAAVAAASYALAFPVLWPDLADRAAAIVEESKASPTPVHTALVLAVASAIPAIAFVAILLARPVLRWLAAIAAIALAAVNHVILTTDYPGAHLYTAWAAAILGTAALATLPIKAPATPARARARTAAAVLGLAGAAALAAWSLLVRPRQVILLALLEERGSTIAPYLMRARAAAPAAISANVPPELRPWFADRSAAPAVPPTSPRLASNPIVILYTIDSVRAEVIDSGENDAALPEMTRIKRDGVHFTMARSPGTGTAFTLAALFMGKYYSDQYWTIKPSTDSTYPWADESLRFPEILTSKGVRTLAFVSRLFMVNEYGIARGFDESVFVKPVKKKGKAPAGKDLNAAMRKRVEKHDGGPLFLWVHNMDAHAPFDMAGTEGSLHDRYVREVGLVDHEIGLLRQLVERKGWADRTYWIVSSDHGEGFLEHGTHGHSTSLYEELLRIPLLISGPGVRPRVESTPVSLIDAGPTILDIFGMSTPGSFLGQSLVPILRGEPAKLTRPICAETRLKQSLILPSGLKLMRDQRVGTTEIYDLVKDPEERNNLVDEPGADREAQLGILAAFFDVHTLKRPGYTPPYRTW